MSLLPWFSKKSGTEIQNSIFWWIYREFKKNGCRERLIVGHREYSFSGHWHKGMHFSTCFAYNVVVARYNFWNLFFVQFLVRHFRTILAPFLDRFLIEFLVQLLNYSLWNHFWTTRSNAKKIEKNEQFELLEKVAEKLNDDLEGKSDNSQIISELKSELESLKSETWQFEKFQRNGRRFTYILAHILLLLVPIIQLGFQ